jgi:hypothetical protein
VAGLTIQQKLGITATGWEVWGYEFMFSSNFVVSHNQDVTLCVLLNVIED